MNKPEVSPETLRIALEFDVPLPATCEELEWEEHTFFVWFQGLLCTHSVENSRHILRGVRSGEVVCDTTFIWGTPAPITRQIAKKLIEKLRFSNLEIIGNRLCYLNCGVVIQNHHFAEAYANIYKKLKQAGLLENGTPKQNSNDFVDCDYCNTKNCVPFNESMPNICEDCIPNFMCQSCNSLALEFEGNKANGTWYKCRECGHSQRRKEQNNE